MIKKAVQNLGLEELSLMSAWEKGSPMRSFIYYLQRATCGALTFLVFHQVVLGLRLVGVKGKTMAIFETMLSFSSTPGRWIMQFFFDPIRPLHMPLPLASFFLNILFYFFLIWVGCYFYNFFTEKSFVGEKKRDPFIVLPRK